MEKRITQSLTTSRLKTNISHTKSHCLQFISRSCQNFLLASWSLISQLLYLTFSTIYLISQIIPSICWRVFLAPLLPRPSCPSCDLVDISPSPSLSPCRKDQAQQEQQTQRNTHSHPNPRRVGARMSGGCRSHRGNGRCIRAGGIVDRCRIQCRGSKWLSKNVGECRIATASTPFFRAAEQAVVVPRITTRNRCNGPVRVH